MCLCASSRDCSVPVPHPSAPPPPRRTLRAVLTRSRRTLSSYGSPRETNCDMITAPITTVLDQYRGAGVSIMLNPGDLPLDLWLYLSVSTGGSQMCNFESVRYSFRRYFR